MPRWPVFRIALALTLASLCLGGATAQAGFAPSNDPVVEAEQLGRTGLGIDAQGNSLVAWSEQPVEDVWEVKARRVSATGAVGPVLAVSLGEDGFRPAVAMTPSGRAFVAWRTIPDPAEDSAKGRWIEPDGTLGPVLTLAQGEPGVEDAGNVEAVVDPAGIVTVAWQNFESNTFELRRVSPDGTLAPLVEDVADGGVTNPVIAALPNGSTLAVWRGTGSEKNVVTADGTVGVPEKISTSNAAGDNEIAVDGIGNSLVVWRQSVGAEWAVFGRRLDPLGVPFGGEVILAAAEAGFVGSQPRVAADGGSDFLVTWTRQDGGNDAAVFVRAVNTAGMFAGSAQVLSAPGSDNGANFTALLDGGVGVGMWREDDEPDTPVLGRAVDGLGVPTGAIEPILGDGFGPEIVRSLPDKGFAAFLVGYAVSGSAQGAVLRRFMVPPTCASTTAAVVQGQPITVPISCAGPALEGAQPLAQPRHGQLGPLDPATLSFPYSPDPGFDGADSFTYAGLNDGGASAAATVTIAVGKDTVKPRIQRLQVLKRVSRSKPPRFSRIRFKLVFSEASTVRIGVQKRILVKGKARFRGIGSVSTKQAAERATVRVNGKLARKMAAGGRFRIRAVATDLARNKSEPRKRSFKLGA